MSVRVIESPASSTGGLTQAQGDNLYVKPLLPNGTDDTTVLQALIDAGGGAVGPGTFLVSTLTPKSNSHLFGQGEGRTIIKLKNGVNGDVFKGQNFDTLTGGSTTTGISKFSMNYLTIDGNKANNTAGYGLRIYGYSYRLQSVEIKNGKSGGVWSEWGTSGTDMEAQWANVRVHDNDGDGIHWLGPHDSYFSNVVSFKNVGANFRTGGNAGGEEFSNCHAWGTEATYGAYFGKPALTANCVFEGATSANLVLADSGNIITGCSVFGTNTGVETGLQIGDTGQSADNSIIGLKLRKFSATGQPINLVNSNNNHVDVMLLAGSATQAISGTIGAGDEINIQCTDKPELSLQAKLRVTSRATASGTVTLVLTDTEHQRFTAALTGALTVNLPATGYSGKRFLIRRAGYGAFALDVGGLAQFPPNITGLIEVVHDGTTWNLGRVVFDLCDRLRAWHKPSVALAETISRSELSSANQNPLISGRLYLVGIMLLKGMVVSSITFFCGLTAPGTPTNQWFALYNPSRSLLSQTPDDTTTAWAASTAKTLSLTTPQTIAVDGIHYLAINVTAATVPTLNGIANLSGISGGLTPALGQVADTGLTATAPSVAGTPSPTGTRAYAYVS